MIDLAAFEHARASGLSTVSRWHRVDGRNVLVAFETLEPPPPTDLLADVSFGKAGWMRLRESVRVALTRYTADHGVPRAIALAAAREAWPGLGDAEAVGAFLGCAG